MCTSCVMFWIMFWIMWWLLFPIVPPVSRMKTPAPLSDGSSRVVPYPPGVHAQLQALSVRQGTLRLMDKQLGPLVTGTRRTGRHKLAPFRDTYVKTNMANFRF